VQSLSLDAENEKAARVAMEIFTTVCNKDKDLFPADMCIKVCSEQLAPFPLLAVTANNHIMVVHRIQCLIVPLTHSHRLKNQVLAFIKDEQKETRFPKIIKLTKKILKG